MKFKLKKLRTEVFAIVDLHCPFPKENDIFNLDGIYYKILEIIYIATKSEGLNKNRDFTDEMLPTLTVTEIPAL